MSVRTCVKREPLWEAWLKELVAFAVREAEMTPDLSADYWRDCFIDGMSPEQAFRESFTEQDGL